MAPSPDAPPRIPVTVLTGFLGSGKTTLLNRILGEQHGRRIAVIENEFGEIDIDSELVLSTRDEITQLANGCVCCTVRGDLIGALRTLAESEACDHVVLETSGLAEPGPILQTFLADPELNARFALDGVVTLVDARTIGLHLDGTPAAVQQIAVADLVVLNKTDLLAAADVATVERRVRAINPVAALRRAVQADIAIDAVLGIGGTDADPTAHDHDDHEHDADITAVALELPGDLNGPLVYRWIGDTVMINRDDLFRTKGLLAIQGATHRAVLQGVHGLVEAREGAPWGDAARVSRIVLIGRRLDRDQLAAGLRACLAQPAERAA